MSSQSSLAPTTTTATPDSSSAIASSTSTGNSGPGGTSTPLYLYVPPSIPYYYASPIHLHPRNLSSYTFPYNNTNYNNNTLPDFAPVNVPIVAARFTFLATLFVLLAVSCAIVLRSFYLRRQLRRRYEAAIAAGLLPPNVLPGHHAGGRKKRDFGEKPKLYDAAVVPSFGEKWEYIVVRRMLLAIVIARVLIERIFVLWFSGDIG